MTDEQFNKFSKNFNDNFAAMKKDLSVELMQNLDLVLNQKFLTFKEEIREEFKQELLGIHGKIDWIVNALDTDEVERNALGHGIDRQLDNHERRIAKLELTTNP